MAPDDTAEDGDGNARVPTCILDRIPAQNPDRVPMRVPARVPIRDRVRSLWAGESFRQVLVARADLRPGQRVLDFGCGVGTLALLVKGRCPGATVVGIDIDEGDVVEAREASADAGMEITFDVYDGGRLPYDEGSFDRILSSLVVHHLDDKVAAFRELRRVLAPGGLVSLVDWGPPRGTYARIAESVVRLYDTIDENMMGLVPTKLREAGFEGASEAGYYNTLSGTMSLYHARRA